MTNKNDWRDEFDKFGEIYSLPHGKYTSVKGDRGEITPYIWEGRWATRSLESFIAQTRKDAVEEVERKMYKKLLSKLRELPEAKSLYEQRLHATLKNFASSLNPDKDSL